MNSPETRTDIPFIDNPAYFRQLARTIDKVYDDLPLPEEVRRGEDISRMIHGVVEDIGNILTDIGNELAVHSREEATDPATYSPAERAGTAALTASAPHLGTALAHLTHVIRHLGLLHESTRTPKPGERPTPSPDEVLALQEYLDPAGTSLRMAAEQLRGNGTQLARVNPGRPATVPAPAAPHPAESVPPRVNTLAPRPHTA